MDDFELEWRNGLSDAEKLEALYRRNRTLFARHLRALEAEISSPLVDFWKARLSYRRNFDWKAIFAMIALALVCWIPTRVIMENSATANALLFRYFPAILFACWGAAVMFIEKRMALMLPMATLSGLVALLFVFLPPDEHSQTTQLAVLHSYLLLWCSIPLMLGRFRTRRTEHGRIHIERTGETLCWATLFLVGGIILTGVTLGLFSALDMQITDFYFKNVVSLGLILSLFLGLYFSGNSIEMKISGILAKVFSPIAAATMTVFLIAAMFSYDKLFTDKDAFVFYSLVPIFVVAIIFFVNSQEDNSKFMVYLNLYLSIVASVFIVMVILPVIFRISSWGITPNKFAVLGIELIFLVNMGFILLRQFAVARGKKPIGSTANTIGQFLPVYLGWSILVIGVLPIVFGFQ